MIHDLADYQEETKPYGFRQLPFTLEYIAGESDNGFRIIEHTTHMAPADDPVMNEMHEVQLYHNFEDGFLPGMGCVGFDKESAQKWILEFVSPSKPVLHDLTAGRSYKGGVPTEVHDEADFFNAITRAGYDHEFLFGTSYIRHFDGYSVHINETITPHQDGVRDMINVEVLELRGAGKVTVLEEAFWDESEATKFVHEAMRTYDGQAVLPEEKAGRLTQTLYWKHQHGYRKIAERGHELTSEDVHSLRQLYDMKTLHLDDEDRTPVHLVTENLEDLIR